MVKNGVVLGLNQKQAVMPFGISSNIHWKSQSGQAFWIFSKTDLALIFPWYLVNHRDRDWEGMPKTKFQ